MLQHQIYSSNSHHHQQEQQQPSSFLQQDSPENNIFNTGAESNKFLPQRPSASYRYPNPHLRQIAKRYQEKRLQQKRHTLLALVKAAIPYPRSQNLRRRPGGSASQQQQHFLASQRRNFGSGSVSQDQSGGEGLRYEDEEDGIASVLDGAGEEPVVRPSLWLNKRGASVHPVGHDESGAIGLTQGSNAGAVDEGDQGSEDAEEEEDGENEGELQDEGEDQVPPQEEVNLGLQQVGNSINHAFFRSTRSSARPYDVPQIGEYK